MALTLYLVRHGRAASSWHEARDPGLDETGRNQAEALAERLDQRIGQALRVVTSPLRRARETAEPLARRWGVAAEVEPRVAEVPSPGLSLAQRGEWLLGLFDSRWPELDAGLWQWRAQALEALQECREDAVYVTHAVMINAMVSALTGDDRVLVFRPDYCSVTVLAWVDGRLALRERGAEARTQVR
ncbi:histidine phosphatase family protein [Aquisalimonas sp.]|uniref:histidine phosphatase family protein n=1 Tax=Aquisalimonas sp. TaxID=1872621 RepID=UPI0025B949F1|nr:histidine phosphatase family protein [Aquisalimonas sp.]